MFSAERRDLRRALSRPALPPSLRRRTLRIPPAATYLCRASEWAGAIVLVERGTLEVECRGGTTATYPAGSLLALGWLPARRLTNVGPVELRLLAVRRSSDRQPTFTGDPLMTPNPKTARRTGPEGSSPMRFRTTVELGGKTATGFRVPTDVVERLGSGKRPAVVVRIGAYTYRSTVASMSGAFYLPLAAEHRGATGIVAGDEIEVEVELDAAPRTVDVPDDFAAALDAEPQARAFFDGLSNSNRKWHVLSVEGAKTEETRRRRIDKSVAMLREGRAR